MSCCLAYFTSAIFSNGGYLLLIQTPSSNIDSWIDQYDKIKVRQLNVDNIRLQVMEGKFQTEEKRKHVCVAMANTIPQESNNS